MLAEITRRIANALGDESGLGKTMKVDFGAGGKIFIDAVQAPPAVNNEDLPADCTVKISLGDFLLLAKGELNPAMAMLQKKLHVEGDVGVAMKLGALLQKSK